MDSFYASELFLTAANQLAITPADCMVIEDAPNGVQAAKAAGCKCIAVANSTSADKLSKADMICASLTDLELADIIALINS